MRYKHSVLWVSSSLMLACGAKQIEDETDVTSLNQAVVDNALIPITLPPGMGDYPGNVALLTDGRILCSHQPNSAPEGENEGWWTLAPDASGSYANSAWQVVVGSSALGRVDNPSTIMRDGRYWQGGGEWTDTPPGNKYLRWKQEIFDPVTNTWSALPDDPFTYIDSSGKEVGGLEDAPTALLADGVTILEGPTRDDGSVTELFDINSATWSPASSFGGIGCEGGSLLLPSGNVFEGDSSFGVYSPDTAMRLGDPLNPGTWRSATAPRSTLTDAKQEIGPFLMLPTGQVLVLGASGHNGLYEESSDTWEITQDTPNSLIAADTPAVVEPDGRVIAVATTVDDGTGPAYLNLWDPNQVPPASSWFTFTSPTWSESHLAKAGVVRMLSLPNSYSTGMGQIFISGGAGQAWLYTLPDTVAPSDSWRPTVSSVWAAYGSYHLTGTQLNGLTTGADIGDDGKMATNYPIVYLVDDGTGAIHFARSFGFDQMAPRPSTGGVCSFTLPDNPPQGNYHVRVSTSGIDSANGVPVAITPDRGWAFIALL
jgi:hypothetical protein